LKFSFKKRININGNQNKVKSPDDNLNDEYSTIKNNKNHYSKENEDKREIININNNTVKVNNEILKEIPNSQNENNRLEEIQKEGEREEVKNEIDIEDENDDRCNRCKEKLSEEWKKPHWKWNLDRNIKFCIKCYEIKEKEYEKIINYCIICESKLKFLRYNPRPEWKIKGQLCRKCWDSKNAKYKSEK
jgi:hypothetical protein